MPRKPKQSCPKIPETLSYADLPPPSAEEREVLIARIQALYDQVNAVPARDAEETL